ncbi:MAG: spore coat associated protein CotJA [Oscillospiraceae bacterium]|nr:spore coat associated protein CotJA [Oscillospiraceae bacterium]MBR3952975.1 spore coat associated protein CotJA [Oscillospiraceae bacterium]
MENNGNITLPSGCENSGEILAMAKVPMQKWCSVYDGATAFSRGTLFPALDLPYIGKEALK